MGISVRNVNQGGSLMDRVHAPSSLQTVWGRSLMAFAKPAKVGFSSLIQGTVKYSLKTASTPFLPDFADNVQQDSSRILKGSAPNLRGLIFPIASLLEFQDNAYSATPIFMWIYRANARRFPQIVLKPFPTETVAGAQRVIE